MAYSLQIFQWAVAIKWSPFYSHCHVGRYLPSVSAPFICLCGYTLNCSCKMIWLKKKKKNSLKEAITRPLAYWDGALRDPSAQGYCCLAGRFSRRTLSSTARPQRSCQLWNRIPPSALLSLTARGTACFQLSECSYTKVFFPMGKPV